MMLAQIVSRLWQLATATTWYQQYPEPVPVTVVEVPTPPPPALDVIEPTPIGEVAPLHSTGESAPPDSKPEEPTAPRDPGPELPPADA
jgi:hypothetical protein